MWPGSGVLQIRPVLLGCPVCPVEFWNWVELLIPSLLVLDQICNFPIAFIRLYLVLLYVCHSHQTTKCKGLPCSPRYSLHAFYAVPGMLVGPQ